MDSTITMEESNHPSTCFHAKPLEQEQNAHEAPTQFHAYTNGLSKSWPRISVATVIVMIGRQPINKTSGQRE